MKEKTKKVPDTPKKVPEAFRLSEKISVELNRRSEMTAIPKVRIVEAALEKYFAGTQAHDLADVAKKFSDRPKSKHQSPPAGEAEKIKALHLKAQSTYRAQRAKSASG